MSVALFLLALLPIARLVPVVIVALIALVTKDDLRRNTALSTLPMVLRPVFARRQAESARATTPR